MHAFRPRSNDSILCRRQSIIAKDIVRSQTPNPNIPTAEHIASLGILPYVKLTLRRSLEDPADVLSRSTVAPGTARLAEPTQSGRLREFHRGLEEEKRELIRLSREELNTLTRAIQAREKRLGKLVGDLDAMIKDSEVSVPDFLQYKKLQHSEAEVQRSTLEAQNYVQTLLTVFERTREAHTVMRKKVEEMREMIDAEERVLRSRYDSLSTAEASAMSFMREYILALHNHMMQQESIRVGMEAQEAEANLVRTALVDVQGDGARRERILVEMARDAEEYKARQQARVLAKLKRTRLKGVMHALQLDRDLGSRGRLTEEKSFSSRDLQHLLDNLPTSRRNLITLDDLQALEKMPLADVQAAILSGESRASIHLEPGASHPHLGSGASFRGGSSAASGSHHKSPSEIFRGFQEVLKTTGAKEPGDIVQVFEKVQFIRREQEQRKARFEEVQTQVRVMTAELARLKTAQDQRVFVQADEFDQPIAIAERRATATNARVQAADKSIATIQLFYDDLIHKLVHMPVPAAKGTRLYTALARLQGAFPGSDRPRERPDPWGDLSPPAGALASGGEGLRPGHSRRGSAVALESIMDEDLAGSAGATTGADGSVGHVRLLGYLTDLEVLLDAIVERNRALESEAGPQGGASLSRSISKMGTRSRMSSLAAAEGAESASPLWHGASFRDGGPPSAPVPEIFSALAAQPIPRSWLRRISHDVDEGGRIAIDGAGGSIKRSRSTSVQRGASEYQRHAPGYDGASGDGSDSDAEERLALGGAATDASAREDLRSSTERKRSVLGTPLSRSVRHPGDAEEVLDRSAVKEFKRRNSLVEAARTPRMSLGADHSGSASVGLQMAADGDAEIEKEATLPTFDGASAEDEEE